MKFLSRATRLRLQRHSLDQHGTHTRQESAADPRGNSPASMARLNRSLKSRSDATCMSPICFLTWRDMLKQVIAPCTPKHPPPGFFGSVTFSTASHNDNSTLSRAVGAAENSFKCSFLDLE